MRITAAKKKTIQNALMVTAIAAILAAGVLAAGSLRGWLGGGDPVTAVLEDGTTGTVRIEAQNIKGGVNIERGGIAYSLGDGAKLRDGDILQTLNGSSVNIVFGENAVSLDENSCATVRISDAGEASLELGGGGLFADIAESFVLRLMDTDVSLESGVFSASAPYGSAGVYVFENAATVGGKTIGAGNAASILQDGIHTAPLSIQSLNSFDLAHIAALQEDKALCFTLTQIEQLAAEREASAQEAAQARLLEDQNAQRVEAQRQENEKKLKEETTGGNTGDNTGETTGDDTNDTGGDTGDNTGGDTDGSTGDNAGGETGQTEGPTCTITIHCDTILDNMGDLTEGKNKYVPANGCILATSKLRFEEGETVFDALKRACALTGIQLEYSWTPMYNSYYIEGINNLYEFDCGNESGWMYKVNGWFPNYGCSAYTLKDGDAIVWCYTCKGLGADVGGGVY